MNKSKIGTMSVFKSVIAAQEAVIGIILVLMCVVISIANPRFLEFENIINILRTTSYVVIIAAAGTFVFVMAGLDLSVGSIMGFSGMIVGLLLQSGLPIWLSILITLIPGTAFGLFNGIAIVKMKIPAMIVTLGTLYVARGIVNVITRGMPIFPLPNSFLVLGNGTLLNIPYSVYIMLIISLITMFVMKRTCFGRYVYAIGGNEEASRLSGINVDLVKIIVYALCALCATISGIIVTSRMGSAQVATGTGWELKVVAAVIIGGTSTFGGAGTMLGTIIGALIMSVLENGLVLANISPFWQNIVIGMIIIITVGFDQFRRNKKKN